MTYPCVHITEQFTSEQEGTVPAVEAASDVDSNALELAVEASQIKDNVPLSLSDDVMELIVQDFFPEDISLDATVVDGENDQEKAVATIPGWFFQIYWNNIFIRGNSITFYLNLKLFALSSSLQNILGEIFSEKITEIQTNVKAVPGETVSIITELPEEGLDVIWLKDNVPLSLIEGKFETINKDYSYQLVIPDVTVADGGQYQVQAGEYESTVLLTVNG